MINFSGIYSSNVLPDHPLGLYHVVLRLDQTDVDSFIADFEIMRGSPSGLIDQNLKFIINRYKNGYFKINGLPEDIVSNCNQAFIFLMELNGKRLARLLVKQGEDDLPPFKCICHMEYNDDFPRISIGPLDPGYRDGIVINLID